MANINAKTSDGLTALHLSIKHGHLSVVELLCERGADVNVYDNDGNDILMFSIINQKINIIKYIIEFYNYTKVNNKGESTIDLARKTGDKELIDIIEARLHIVSL